MFNDLSKNVQSSEGKCSIRCKDSAFYEDEARLSVDKSSPFLYFIV